MNSGLTTEYLYEVLTYASEKQKDIESIFGRLFLNEDFIMMIMTKPFDIQRVLSVVDSSKKKGASVDKNKIRYLSFLISMFLDKTIVEPKKIPQYISPSDVFGNFNYYHSQDVDNIIFLLINQKNERYKLRKINKNKLLDESQLLNNFLKLYPIKKFSSFNEIFDQKLLSKIYVSENDILFYSDDINDLLDNQYFVYRYCVGNRVFCFTSKEQTPHYRSSLYLFIINDDGIKLIEPSGQESIFQFSN